MDEIEKTNRTYAQIATAYAQAQQHRHMLARHVARFVALVPPGGLVWDVGCGPGFDTAVLRQHHLHAYGLDYSHPMITAGRELMGQQNIFIQADMRHLPFCSCADGLWVCASLLHLPRRDAPAALQEFYRALRPGGILYLSVKMGEGERWVEGGYGRALPRFFTYWQSDELDNLLTKTTFKIIDGWIDHTDQTRWLIRFAVK